VSPELILLVFVTHSSFRRVLDSLLVFVTHLVTKDALVGLMKFCLGLIKIEYCNDKGFTYMYIVRLRSLMFTQMF